MQTMRTRAALHVTAAVRRSASASAAQAVNLSFLRDTPVAAMQRQDHDALLKVLRGALDQKADGEAAQGASEGQRRGTRVDATVSPDHTTHDGNRTGRDTTVVQSARGQSMTLRPRFCSEGSGERVFQRTH